jgi:Icc-related predicted phosphoesterase
LNGSPDKIQVRKEQGLIKKMMAKVKDRVLLWLVFTVLFLSFAGLFGWAIKLHRDYQSIPSEHLIGNRVSNVNALREKGFPFSFLVISDTHNSNIGETLLKVAMDKEDVSFLIHVGDFVNGPDLWDHRFFLTNMTVEIKPPFPVFLAAGNHDIDYTSKIKPNEQRVTPEIYESLYGPRNFDFIFNNCLFIICEIDPRDPTGYLHYLRETLSQKGGGRKYIFIFFHYPPERLVKYKDGAPIPNEEEFFNLVESYKVTACFFGHYHGYRRAQTKGVNLIVLGGGGGRTKSWQSKWGKFHHLLKINVNENQMTEDILTLPGEVTNFRRTFEKWTFLGKNIMKYEGC